MSASAPPAINEALLAHLAEVDVTSALSELAQRELVHAECVRHLIDQALTRFDSATDAAERWLTLAALVNEQLDNPALLRGDLEYARARLYTQQAQFSLAEAAIRTAQRAWQATGALTALARSHLGLTQVLAVQGRYAEAERAAHEGIAVLAAAHARNEIPLGWLAVAYRNLATVLVYQERHQSALTSYDQARRLLEERLAAPEIGAEETEELRRELAHLSLNRASAWMFLDRTYEAEAALHAAIDGFDQLQDQVNRGRGRTNLGALYLRTGRYAAALSQFEGATRDLVGELPFDRAPAPDQLRNADTLLFDQATAYLAVNLLPDADESLRLCAILFAHQPYELAQTRWAQGLVRHRLGDVRGAEAFLLEAQGLFEGLANQLWLHRVALALATLAYAQGERVRAEARLAPLLAVIDAPLTDDAPVDRDQALLAETYLLRVRLDLANDDVAAATQTLTTLRRRIGASAPAEDAGLDPLLPQVAVRLNHVAGLVAQAAGHQAEARRLLEAAINLLERQRATLPVEEVRMAFLDDKSTIYADLVLNLLRDGAEQSRIAAFGVMERARSQVLIARLQAAVIQSPADDPLAAQRQAIQQELHLLYNRMLGESGARNATSMLIEEIRPREATLARLAWRAPLPLAEAAPVALATLQAALMPDQQAVVYYFAGDELLAYLVGRADVQVVRQLCHVQELEVALGEWQFQLGRAETGADYRARHNDRFRQATFAALQRLYELIFAPLTPHLWGERLLFAPHGPLHQAPLHALWSGEQFVIEAFECSYTPSATLAVALQRPPEERPTWRSWAGLALDDPTIPGAQLEIEVAARHFAAHWLYRGDEASLAALRVAAQQADILHLATHGLFRPDNPFCSVLKLADGWVDVRTLYDLPLHSQLVVLSACESGAVAVRGGDEVIGLARGFLAAGARSLLVSLWNVHDVSTSVLMDGLYAALTGPAPRPAAALRTAQLGAIRNGRPVYEWAPFLVIGA
jgi:CHAT domain-containing protein/tetratricopeptide (TPR) repeat protein